MLKKLFIILLMFLYLYTATFDIFLNRYFKIPTPLMFGLPLVILFANDGFKKLLYIKELIVFFLIFFFFYLIGQQDQKSFFVNIIILTIIVCYFNYFVGEDRKRFNLSIIVFYFLLGLSTLIMLLDHSYPVQTDDLRGKLLGAMIMQSPSGIASKIFNFGYQLAAFVGFLFIITCTYKQHIVIKVLALLVCLVGIYYGMQRSVLFTFLLSVIIFLLFYYRFKIILIMILPIILIVYLVTFTSVFKSKDAKHEQNIFAKNERNADNNEERGDLIPENLKIISDYPLGLIFYGKDWTDVTRKSSVFKNGLTSHNAYLMFITYLGPFLAIPLLIGLFYKVGKIFELVLNNIKLEKYAILIGLCFSFLSVTLNAMFHNSSILDLNGSTIFVYFSILHLNNMINHDEKIV